MSLASDDAIGPVGLALLRPWFRYSETRQAFVLRVASRHGPVFVRRDRHKPGE